MRTKLAAVVFGACLGLAGCGGDAPAVKKDAAPAKAADAAAAPVAPKAEEPKIEWVRYSDAAAKWGVDMPKDWSKVDIGVLMIFSMPTESLPVPVTFNVKINDLTGDFAAWHKETFPAAKLGSEKVGGADVPMHEEPGSPHNKKYYFFVKDKKVAMLTTMAFPDRAEASAGLFKHVVESFKWE